MRKSRFSESQIVEILKEAEGGVAVADLRYLSDRLPDTLVAFHDPNFGVRFDETMTVMERIPVGRRSRYIMESALAIMKPARLERLRDTNCVFAAPGVESWGDYSNKAGVGAKQGRDKLEQVVSHFDLLGHYVPGLADRLASGVASTIAILEQAPGVRAVAATQGAMFDGASIDTAVRMPGQSQLIRARVRYITGSFVEASGTRLLRGSSLTHPTQASMV